MDVMAESTTESPDRVILATDITADLVASHGLTPEEYETLQKLIGKTPNLVELGVFSVMWSEHCAYKNSRPLLKTFPTEKADKNAPGQVLVKAGEENAGVIDIGGGWAICFKIESHNHPSAVEPFEGAATGVGGILRDIFTMGARPIVTTNSIRFGDLSSSTVRRLFRGVVAGIAHYGNCMGIPCLGGETVFDACYEGNPLVNALALGVLRTDEIKRGAASGVGNPVFYVGAATGRDGLGGAAFASRELTEESAEDRPAVQKGDPFMEKLLLEACLEMMQVPGLVVGIQDMGAAGLTCSTCETASRGHTGIEIDLDKVPQRETGMNAYEIMLSESQERMLVIVQKGREDEIRAIFEKWDLHAAEVGVVTDTGQMVVKHLGETVVDVPALSLTDDAPVYQREAREPSYLAAIRSWKTEDQPEPDLTEIRDALPTLLAHPNLASKAWVYTQYDYHVRHGTIVEPGADAGVFRVKTDGEDRYLAIANDGNHRFGYLNPYRGAVLAIAECCRNLACVGARPLGMTNNLNFGNPYKPDAFWALAESVRGLADACRFFDVPVSGGNVSLYNENPRGAIDPTPVVSIVGQIDRFEDITTPWIKEGDETLLLLGGWPTDLAGSLYQSVVFGTKAGDAPEIDLGREQRLHQLLRELISEGKIHAAHDISDGGLLPALCEMLFAREQTFGASIDIPEGVRLDVALFGESPGRVLVAVRTPDAVTEKARETGIEVVRLGAVQTEDSLAVSSPKGQESWNTNDLRRVWEEAIPRIMDAVPTD